MDRIVQLLNTEEMESSLGRVKKCCATFLCYLERKRVIRELSWFWMVVGVVITIVITNVITIGNMETVSGPPSPHPLGDIFNKQKPCGFGSKIFVV